MEARKVRMAAVQTDTAQIYIRGALESLGRTQRDINACGVYVEPHRVDHWLAQAIDRLQNARRVIAGTEWPNRSDYA